MSTGSTASFLLLGAVTKDAHVVEFALSHQRTQEDHVKVLKNKATRDFHVSHFAYHLQKLDEISRLANTAPLSLECSQLLLSFQRSE